MSSKKATPKGSINSKEVLTKLFTCGSGKKQLLSDHKNLPTEAPEEETDYLSKEVKTVQAMRVETPMKNNEEEQVEISYTDIKTIGKGTFGVVYKAHICEDSKIVAIKKVFDDKRYKNRELLFMKQLHHPNIANLVYYFYTEDAGCRKGERYLNMVLEFVPDTLFGVAKCDGTYTKPLLDPLYIKVYTYQMFRCLNYLHSQNICHRDIKPQNLLINPSTHILKLCDFGSAKELLKNESNVSYICSRYYRAPELIFGAKDYNCLIDMWSGGCVLGELFQGHPLFPGATGPDQLVEIMKVLGTPSYEDIMDINHNINNMRLPPVLIPMPWHKIFTKQQLSYDATDLISKLLVFSPKKRLDALSACAHPFFNELRNRGVRLPDGSPLPPLFNFTKEEIVHSPLILERLTPPGWSEEWNTSSLLDHPPGTSHVMDDGSIKNKLVKLARNSFKKTSFKKEHYHVPSYDIGNHEEDVEPTIDVMDLAQEARQRMDEMIGGDMNNEQLRNISRDVVDLSIKETPEKEVKGKRKKKKKETPSLLGLESLEDGTDPHVHRDLIDPSTQSPHVVQLKREELDSTVPFDIEENSSIQNDSKSRKKKKKMKSRGNYEEDVEAWRDEVAWDGSVGNLDEDVMRAVSSSTPADFEEISPDIKVVRKHKTKKKNSADVLHEGSLDDLEASVHASDAHVKDARGRYKVATRTTQEAGYDVMHEGHVVKTAVTKTTTVEGKKKRKKKKMVERYDEDEV